MLPISSGDVLISASVSRNTRQQPSAAQAQLTDDTFALVCARCAERSQREKRDAGKTPLRTPLRCTVCLWKASPARRPGAVQRSGAVPALSRCIPALRSLRPGRGAAALTRGGARGGEGRGVAGRRRRRRGERRAPLAPLAARRSRPGNSAKSALPPLPRPGALQAGARC